MPAPNVTYGIRDIPRTEYGSGFGIRANDIEAGAALANIGTAGLLPSNIGLPVINKTGVSIPSGSLLYVNSRDSASGLATVALADADAIGARAQWIALAAIPNNGQATVGQQLAFPFNTNVGNVGDPVYLSTTPGLITLTAPSATNAIVQQVGNVTVKAVAGTVNLALFYNSVPTQLGLNEINSLLLAQPVRIPLGTIPTTGTVEQLARCPATGQLVGASFRAQGSLVTSDSNFITVSVTDKGLNGAGSTALLTSSAGGANTTKTTGGSGGIVAYANNILLPVVPQAVVAGDTLSIQAVVSGTLPGTVALFEVDLIFTRTS